MKQITYLFLLTLIWQRILFLVLLFTRCSKELFWFGPVFKLFSFFIDSIQFVWQMCNAIIEKKRKENERNLIEKPNLLLFETQSCWTSVLFYFNHDLNRDCLASIFSLRFSRSKFLINLQRQFRVRKFFSCTQKFSYTSF